MMIPFQPTGNDNNDNISDDQLLNAILAGHAMADFFRADEAALAAFAAFMNNADQGKMRERLNSAHDVLVVLSAQLLFASLTGGNSGNEDEEPIRTFRPPF